MLWNALANEALPVFLDSILPGWVAVLISVTLVLLFGEIIPASVTILPPLPRLSPPPLSLASLPHLAPSPPTA